MIFFVFFHLLKKHCVSTSKNKVNESKRDNRFGNIIVSIVRNMLNKIFNEYVPIKGAFTLNNDYN